MDTLGACGNEALALLAAGLTPVPVLADGSKQPAVKWKPLMSKPPSVGEVVSWYMRHPEWGVGVACGNGAGGVEMLEIEGRAKDRISLLAQRAKEAGIEDIWEEVCHGWSERSPSGGIHFYYRVDGEVERNSRLAVDRDKKVLAETRGAGGYSIIAPTPGRCHNSGVGWARYYGGADTIPTLSLAQRRSLHEVFASLDQRAPQLERTPARPFVPSTPATSVDGAVRPGDDFAARTSWEDILVPAGWKMVGQRGEVTDWCRPDKEGWGVSATTGWGGDVLYVFTTSSVFEPERGYTKFTAYAILNHGGDIAAAAKELARQGYGHMPERRPTGRQASHRPKPNRSQIEPEEPERVRVGGRAR